jgi:membrane protease YdiL (CAAX protease family)
MPQPLDESTVFPWVIALFAASIVTWVYLFTTWWSYGVVLPYKRRQPVPWGAWASALAVLHVVGRLAGSPGLEPDKAEATEMAASKLAFGALTHLLLVGLFVAAVVVVSRATRADLGLPESKRQALGDARIGILACLAAYVPVAVVRLLVVHQLGEPELHPMLQDVLKRPDAVMLAIAFVSAAVVAPVCEELIFRLLLQGWLEKWEDQMLGWRVEPMRSVDPTVADIPDAEAPPVPAPPAAGLFGMPYGALPVLASSTMFAWAHIGHSTDPFPLFVLALFLGFVYQRTHRILPCIVAHATFNSISMLMLWRILIAG